MEIKINKKEIGFYMVSFNWFKIISDFMILSFC